MSNSSRPGGLTALAVLNFVFSGIWCIWAMILAIGLFLADKTGLKAEKSIVTIQLLFALIIPTLLVISGIGYLQQKRVMGKILGNVYALTSLLSTVFAHALANADFTLGSIFFLIYPILTLFLLNTVFSDDFQNSDTVS